MTSDQIMSITDSDFDRSYFEINQTFKREVYNKLGSLDAALKVLCFLAAYFIFCNIRLPGQEGGTQTTRKGLLRMYRFG